LLSGELSELVLPRSGNKSVAGEAFGKLSAKQKSVVAANVNEKTKKVTQLQLLTHTASNYICVLCVVGRKGVCQRTSF
jgi:hypothetical protein